MGEGGRHPLADINNREKLEAWLQTQPREVSVALAARAGLRALPAVRMVSYYLSDTALAVFRATAVSWAAAQYPTHEKELSHAADAADSFAEGAAFATYDSPAAQAALEAAALAAYAVHAAANAGYAADAAAAAARAATDEGDAAADFWSAVSTDARNVAEGTTASVIAGSPLWPQDQPGWLRSLWQELKESLLTLGQNWQAWVIWYEDRLEGRVGLEERELAYVRIAEMLWQQGHAEVNAGIMRRIEDLEPPSTGQAGTAPFDTKITSELDLPQPPEAPPPGPVTHFVIKQVEADEPPPIESILDGVVQLQASSRAVARGFAGPLSVAERAPPIPIENVPSAVSFGLTSKGTITVVSGPQDRPVFPFQGGELDHANRLEACRVLATDAARSLRNGRSNARSEYAEILDQYIAYLPKQPREGNFLLADAKARIIREMFAAEQDFLPVPFAAELKVLLEQHIGLRAYYPATEEFYESVRSGHLERPLPIDAAEGFIQGVRDNTPILFEPNVADTLQGVAQPLPQISKHEAGFGANIPPHPVPPPDPLDPIDPEKSRHFTLASGINTLWKAVSSGKKVEENLEGWSKVIAILGPYAAPILEWLRSFVSGT
jgi:hypothetical protein